MSELISVIVPLYNAENYIDDCIQSIKRQTYFNIEVILIDDLSTDHSVETAEKYISDDPRFTILRNSRNMGVAATRNIGIQSSSGKWLLFMDADDAICEDLIEFLHGSIDKTCRNFVLGPYQTYIDDGSGMLQYDQKTKISDKAEISVEQYTADTNGYRPHTWGCLFDADIVRSKNIQFCETSKYGEDVCFNIKYASCFDKITILSGTGYIYRLHENSLSFPHIPGKENKNTAMVVNRATIVEAYQDTYDFLTKNNPTLLDSMLTGRSFPIANILFHMKRLRFHDRELYRNLRALLSLRYVLRYAKTARQKSFRYLTLGMYFAPDLTVLIKRIV